MKGIRKILEKSNSYTEGAHLKNICMNEVSNSLSMSGKSLQNQLAKSSQS